MVSLYTHVAVAGSRQADLRQEGSEIPTGANDDLTEEEMIFTRQALPGAYGVDISMQAVSGPSVLRACT